MNLAIQRLRRVCLMFAFAPKATAGNQEAIRRFVCPTLADITHGVSK
jgi:hypothetical protein